MSDLVLLGRSSSHFTRVARIFAHELRVAYRFEPVFDLTSLEPDNYAGNPTLKVPILVDEQGPLFGTENICRELARRSNRAEHVVLRGATEQRVVANAEELLLHAMTTEVTIITSKFAKEPRPVPPKVEQSLGRSLRELDHNVERVLAALPERQLSFFEVGLFCVVEHLPFREVADVTPYPRLVAFSKQFGERASARDTEYRFDTPS